MVAGFFEVVGGWDLVVTVVRLGYKGKAENIKNIRMRKKLSQKTNNFFIFYYADNIYIF